MGCKSLPARGEAPFESYRHRPAGSAMLTGEILRKKDRERAMPKKSAQPQSHFRNSRRLPRVETTVLCSFGATGQVGPGNRRLGNVRKVSALSSPVAAQREKCRKMLSLSRPVHPCPSLSKYAKDRARRTVACSRSWMSDPFDRACSPMSRDSPAPYEYPSVRSMVGFGALKTTRCLANIQAWG